MNDWINRCHFGDVRVLLRAMAADGVKVQTIVTSPPYWGLRSYLPAGHPDKAFEIGSEPTLREFIDGMVEVFDLCRDVLADDGTMWVNMGDSYATGTSSPRNDSPQANHGGWANGARMGGRRADVDGLPAKNLIGQPWRLAFALQDAGWWLRQDIIWHKPNPMPESIRDRCTKAHEYVFLLSKSERYHYDFDAMQEPVNGGTHARRKDKPAGWDSGPGGHRDMVGRYPAQPDPNVGRRVTKTNGVGWGYTDGEAAKPRTRKLAEGGGGTKLNPSFDEAIVELATRRNRRSVWTIPSEPYSGAHFATFPRALVEPCILAGCPVGGTVLDIFFGSGTTGQVAQALGRNFIGIELNAANAPLQAERLRQPSLMLGAA